MRTETWFKRLLLCVVALSLCSADVFAQSRVRVVQDRSAIWNQRFITVATYVKAGTELEVVGHRDTWYEVVIPIDDGRRVTGFIADVNVEPVGDAGGSPAGRPATPPRTSSPPTPRGQGTPPRLPSRTAAVPASAGLGSGVRAFGHFGYGSFLASKTFDAVMGDAPGQLRGPWYGGGVQFQSRSGIFVEAGVDRFHQTGERVFVLDGTVSKLGVPDRFTVIPLTIAAGYRLPARRAAPFLGGGIGQYFFSETTPFDDPSEKVNQHATSYQVLGGVEFSLARAAGAAVQVQYTRVPNALSGGVAAAFNEQDLGGLQLGVKLLIGR